MRKVKSIPTFAEVIMEDNEHLHIIAFNNECLLAVDRNNNNQAKYFYRVNSIDGLSFEFDMLSEVGERYQAWFKETIKLLHYTVGTYESKTEYFDTLTAPNN